MSCTKNCLQLSSIRYKLTFVLDLCDFVGPSRQSFPELKCNLFFCTVLNAGYLWILFPVLQSGRHFYLPSSLLIFSALLDEDWSVVSAVLYVYVVDPIDLHVQLVQMVS